jgi:hypothetical protein
MQDKKINDITANETRHGYRLIPALIDRTVEKMTANPAVMKALPWLAGAGIAAGQILVASNCSVTKQGQCNSCGSCIIAIGSLVGWTYLKRNKADEFYLDNKDNS